MEIITNPLPKKGMNSHAFSGDLRCPFCDFEVDSDSGLRFPKENKKSRGIEFVENIGPYMRRYRCKTCNGKFRYDYALNPTSDPYASFKRGLKSQ